MAEPHLDHFQAFERWAQRSLVADPAFTSRATLEETVFAPILREQPVWGVWIIRQASVPMALHYGHRPAVPEDLRWVVVRPGGTGPVEVSAAKLPDPRSPITADGHPCVLLRRHTGAVTVVVAYRVGSEVE